MTLVPHGFEEVDSDVLVNSLMFLVYMAHRDDERNRLNILLRRVADRARTWDEYELAADIRSIGGNHTRIVWNNLEWTIEDFLSLLIAADDLELAREEGQLIEDDRAREIIAASREDPYPGALLDDPIVSPHRNFLKRFLLWYSIYYDTRIERLFCKLSNVLIELHLACPPSAKILNMRRLLFRCIGSYIWGYCSKSFFLNAVEKAYTRGANIITSLEEGPADVDTRTDPDEWLFDPYETVFGSSAHVKRLVLRSKDMIIPDNEEENEEKEEDDDVDMIFTGMNRPSRR